MTARSKARKRALDVLYESDLRGRGALDTLSEHRALADAAMNDYTAVLVEGVEAHRERIDQLLSENAKSWAIDRMPAVDRNILRLGVFELLWADDVPDAVAVSEAVNLARDLSTDESPSFVNGLLARVLELKPTLAE